VAHISDEVLDCSRCWSRLAVECSYDHVAAELQQLSLRLLFAAIDDAEIMVNELPVLCVPGLLE